MKNQLRSDAAEGASDSIEMSLKNRLLPFSISVRNMTKLVYTVLGFAGFFLLSLALQSGVGQSFLIRTCWKAVPAQIVDYSERPTSADTPGMGTVTYNFAVDGKTYSNRGLRPARRFTNRTLYASVFSACGLVDPSQSGGVINPFNNDWNLTDWNDTPEYMKQHYPVGKIVEVYYNPSNPKVSVLEPGFDRTAFWRMYFPNWHFWYKG